MNFGTMISMIKDKSILNSTRTTKNMMRTDYDPKTMGQMIMIAKKMNMLMMTNLIVKKTTVWAMKGVKMLMMTRMKMLMITSKGGMKKATMILAI